MRLSAFSYDPKGNLTSDGTNGYCYDSDNRLTGAGSPSNCTATATLAYDPFGRLQTLSAGGTATDFAYDGLNMLAEYDGSGMLQRRYVFGPGTDEPIVQYEGSGTADRRWLYADERGSVMAIADASGNVIATNAYDEYGNPPLDGSGHNLNSGRFQYTGQAWLPELGLYYYKARLYSPNSGPVPAARPHRLCRRWAEPLRLCARRSRELCRSAGAVPISWNRRSGSGGRVVPALGFRARCWCRIRQL